MGEKRKRLLAGGPERSAPPPTAADAEPPLASAWALLRQGRSREALAAFERANRAAPLRPEAFHGMGLCHANLGTADIGLLMLARAVELQPEGVDLRAAYGRALSAAGRFDDAIGELEAAAALAPGDAQLRRDLGAILVHRQRFTEGERWYREAAQLAPGRADLHLALALLQYRRDALDEAQHSQDRSLALDPGIAARVRIGSARCPGAAPAAPDRGPAAAAAWTLLRRGHAVASDEALRAACAERELVIVDDLLPDPQAYRRQALALDFAEAVGGPAVNFPGRQTAGQPCQPIMQRIAGALGRDIKWKSPDNGAFRLSPAASLARNDIHVDTDDPAGGPMYAALLYLTPPRHCRGGTSFFRHRPSGWERRPTQDELRAQGMSSFAEFSRRWTPNERIRPFDQIAAGRDQDWEFLFEVPMRFNRLVAYRGDFFHAVSEVFGQTGEDSRLVQLFYFTTLPAAPFCGTDPSA